VQVVGVTPLYPPSLVGSWLSTHLCLRALVSRGHNVTVVASLASGNRYTLDGVQVIPGRRGRSLATMISKADVVVSHMGDHTNSHVTAVERRTRSVVMVHGVPIPEHVRRLGDVHPDVMVFNSRSLLDLVNWPGPTVVIRPPVTIQDYRTTPGDKVTLVNVSEAKGGKLFVRLAAALPDVGFLGVRGGYGAQVIRKRPNIEFIPQTPRMRDEVYARTRILVMPSQAETWGRTGVEAMCSGIPVVATPTPGLLESLGDAGVFVERRDLKGWVAAIQRLSDPEEWATASERATARAEELCSEDSAEEFADLIEDLETAT
jgi:glycosyltransferase involved in cell wall biosynthesis